MSRSAILIRRVLALAAVFLVAVLAVPAFTAGAAAHDNNVQWTELGHNSRDPLFRDPGGAVPTGTAVRLRLRVADGDLTAAKVRVWNDRIDQQTIYNMVKVASGVTFTGDANVYEFWRPHCRPAPTPRSTIIALSPRTAVPPPTMRTTTPAPAAGARLSAAAPTTVGS